MFTLPRKMINVKDEGAQGDGVTNDYTVFDNLIQAANGALFFPPGRYRIDSTLVFPEKTGQHIFDCVMAERVLDGSSAQGCESVLVWGGADGPPMIRYHGEGLVWH